MFREQMDVKSELQKEEDQFVSFFFNLYEL